MSEEPAEFTRLLQAAAKHWNILTAGGGLCYLKQPAGSWRSDDPFLKHDMNKLFSVEEATTLIPRLRTLLGRIQSERQRMVDFKTVLDPARDGHTKDWGTPRGGEYIEILDSFQAALKEIEDLGVLVKDLEAGLCDFPHWREGRVVYLCWKLDEEKIEWWHDIDAGFAGRQPL
ncbi:MAG: DUF2203 domain-containing protein [Acidobacteriota bacterium]